MLLIKKGDGIDINATFQELDRRITALEHPKPVAPAPAQPVHPPVAAVAPKPEAPKANWEPKPEVPPSRYA